MAAGSPITTKRGQEVTVKVQLQIRSDDEGTVSEADLSGSPTITWKAVQDLRNSPTVWLTKTTTDSDVSIVTDGTSGTDAVIQFTLNETDTATRRYGYWICFMVSGGVTTPFEPGRFTIEAYPSV